MAETKGIGKKLVYRKFEISVDSMEKGKEVSFSKAHAPDGTLFLCFGIRLKNLSNYINIMFPDEEASMIAASGAIQPENYKIENNLDPGKESSGFLLFIVPEDLKKAQLQFGKKNEAKTSLDIVL